MIKPALSASKLKTFDSCNVMYWFQYVLKIPQQPSPALMIGSATHKILEVYSEPEFENEVKQIIATNTLTNSCIEFIKKTIQEYHVPVLSHKNENSEELIKDMVLVGFKADFLCEGGKRFKAESRFCLDRENFKVNGVIDAYVDYGEFIEIRDFKSSQKKFAGEELDANIQGLVYSLYIREKYKKPARIKFIFLRQPDDPFLEIKPFTDSELDGFEMTLEQQAKKIGGLNFDLAKLDMAANKDYPKDGSFGGPLMCGRGKEIGQLKKDLSLMYQCPFKHPFDYYIVGKEKTLFKPKSGKFETKHFEGCPAFAKYHVTKTQTAEDLFDF